MSVWLQSWLTIPRSYRYSLRSWDGDQDAFEQLYFAITRQARLSRAFPSPEELQRRSSILQAAGVVPLALAYLEFHLLPAPIGLVLPVRALMAAAPLLHRNFEILTPLRPVHAGNAVRYILTHDLCIGPEPHPASIEFAAGDGSEFTPLHFDEEKLVKYAFPGKKSLVLRCSWAGHKLTARTCLFLEQNGRAPSPPETR